MKIETLLPEYGWGVRSIDRIHGVWAALQ